MPLRGCKSKRVRLDHEHDAVNRIKSLPTDELCRYPSCMAETPHLESLNEAQRAAVTFDAAAAGRAAPGRPLMIIAGAG